MPFSAEQIEEIAVNAAVTASRQSVHRAAELAADKVALSHDDITKVVSQAVTQTLVQLGIDSNNPIDMQKDFQHLRQWREAGEEIKKKTRNTVVGIFIVGLVGLIVVGFREWLKIP